MSTSPTLIQVLEYMVTEYADHKPVNKGTMYFASVAAATIWRELKEAAVSSTNKEASVWIEHVCTHAAIRGANANEIYLIKSGPHELKA